MCSLHDPELPALNDLQKRYQNKEVLVADVTTYERNSSVKPATRAKIEAAINAVRLKKAPQLSMVIASDQALGNYGIDAFPVVVVIDKSGRIRYIGREIDFDEDDPVGHLLRKLVE